MEGKKGTLGEFPIVMTPEVLPSLALSNKILTFIVFLIAGKCICGINVHLKVLNNIDMHINPKLKVYVLSWKHFCVLFC